MASQLEGTNGLFDLTDDSASYLQERKKGDDGIYRPTLDKAKNKSKGYSSVIRILPNLLIKDGKPAGMGVTALEKHIHYADFKETPELSGYVDCKKNFEQNCELCEMYWKLHKSKNPLDQEKAKLISRTTKYYTYILVVEDENSPDQVGKVLVWQYGFKIMQKIKAEYEGRKPCRVEDLQDGMDLELIIKEVGGYTNYDSSKFVDRGPITIGGKQLSVDKTTGKISAADQPIIIDLLLNRGVELDAYKAQPWSEEVTTKVNKIMAALTGNYTPSASNVTYSGAGSTAPAQNVDDVLGSSSTTAVSGVTDGGYDDNFFDGIDDIA